MIECNEKLQFYNLWIEWSKCVNWLNIFSVILFFFKQRFFISAEFLNRWFAVKSNHVWRFWNVAIWLLFVEFFYISITCLMLMLLNCVVCCVFLSFSFFTIVSTFCDGIFNFKFWRCARIWKEMKWKGEAKKHEKIMKLMDGELTSCALFIFVRSFFTVFLQPKKRNN